MLVQGLINQQFFKLEEPRKMDAGGESVILTLS
jgi:hypothetical protein